MDKKHLVKVLQSTHFFVGASEAQELVWYGAKIMSSKDQKVIKQTIKCNHCKCIRTYYICVLSNQNLNKQP